MLTPPSSLRGGPRAPRGHLRTPAPESTGPASPARSAPWLPTDLPVLIKPSPGGSYGLLLVLV